MKRQQFLLVPLLIALFFTWSTPGFAQGGTEPTVLVDENVQRIDVEDGKAWWWWVSTCIPGAAVTAAEINTRVSDINRIPTVGGLTRSIFTQDETNLGCGDWSSEIRSNVVFDADFAYWMSSEYDGLVKLSVEANEGDEPTLVYNGQGNAKEIAERGDYVWLMDESYGIVRVNKGTGAANEVTSVVQLGGPARDLQVDADFVYWNQNGFLKYQTASGGAGSGIANGTTGYTVDLCDAIRCRGNLVFVAQGGQIRLQDVSAGTVGLPIYTSPINGAAVVEMTVDEANIYFWERRPVGCEPFCTYDYGLYRMSRTGGRSELLYFLTEQIFSNEQFDLDIGGPEDDYLFWTDSGQLKRLPSDAEAIPSIDVAITNVEVTQAIQDLDNSIDLIQSKRTGVRVHVDAAGQNVPGITARLYRINGGNAVIDGPISPSSGTQYLTAQDNPNREVFDHAFYFALPKSWTDDTTLRLRAEINFNQLPPEPNFSNNALDTQTFNLVASPTLRTHLIVWGYTVDGTYYEPRPNQDVAQARSWIRRAYPVASTTGSYDSPDPGVRIKTRIINDPNLGGFVERTSELCLAEPEGNREFCAAGYANNCAKWLRATEGIPDNELIYSMIWHDPSLPFPRGYADGNVSAGPTGQPSPQIGGWDTDGSYGDWYMAHEVGHSANRNHPSQGNFCGHSASDAAFPYPNAAIGADDMWGFDIGDIGLNASLPPRVYPNDDWRDLMSYCANQWISDYTYTGIYDFLDSVSAAGTNSPLAVRAGDDFIALFGTIYDNDDSGSFQVVGLWDSPGPYAVPSGGPFRMRFLNGDGIELVKYDFDGQANDADPAMFGFDVVVPFPANTKTIEMLRVSDGVVLSTHSISTNPPTINNVELVGAPSPVTGIVTLQWQASDPDGDALIYDVYYTDDNGATYTAYALALSEPTVQLDTVQMAGSNQARFRVTANDGTRTAEAESATFKMASKPPTVTFLTPQDGLEVPYGTQVNLLVEVEDLQGHLPDAGMEWLINGMPTGVTGPDYTAYLLPIGSNEITLRATNINGQATEQSVTVIVNDDVSYPGPKLAVGPDQVNWQVPEDTTDAQQATLEFSNIGTGDLEWTAGSEAPWLNLGAAGGSTPAMLTLSADPTQVAPGTRVSTVIVVSGNNGQSLELPVSLLVGIEPIWDAEDAPTTESNELFLPIITR